MQVTDRGLVISNTEYIFIILENFYVQQTAPQILTNVSRLLFINNYTAQLLQILALIKCNICILVIFKVVLNPKELFFIIQPTSF